jgi:hypothetical protein
MPVSILAERTRAQRCRTFTTQPVKGDQAAGIEVYYNLRKRGKMEFSADPRRLCREDPELICFDYVSSQACRVLKRTHDPECMPYTFR